MDWEAYMKFVLGAFLAACFFTVSVKADDLADLTKRVERLEKLITEKRWSCSAQCKIYSSPNGTYYWSATKVASGGDVGDTFQALINKCDEFFEHIGKTSGYTLQIGKYDDDGNANLKRNCVSVNIAHD